MCRYLQYDFLLLNFTFFILEINIDLQLCNFQFARYSKLNSLFIYFGSLQMSSYQLKVLFAHKKDKRLINLRSSYEI